MSGILSTENFRMDAKKLGKKIKLARVEHDLTQEKLAEAIESTQRSISLIENGQTLPSLAALENLSRVLKKPYSYFLEEVI